jgi:hypothetical protein
VGKHNLPVHQRTKLYECHTIKDSDNFEMVTGEVRHADDTFVLKNVSDKTWTVAIAENIENTVPGASITLTKGMNINFGGGSAEIV